MPHRINLETTRILHRQLIDSAAQDPHGYREISQRAANILAEHGTKFEGNTAMAFVLSALCLNRDSFRGLQSIAETLHEIVESALDWIFASPERFEKHFPDQMRIRPWMRKTRGCPTWQGVSRYDAVILDDGSVRILELNTGCPAGFMHAEDFSQVTQDAMQALHMENLHGENLGLRPNHFGTIPNTALVDELLAIEAQAQMPNGLIGLVNDENGLLNELQLIGQAFQRRGRDSAIMNASEIEYRNGQAAWNGQPVSLMYNKIRVSTAHSPKHHWHAGFETRYAGFLAAIQNDAAVAVNNLASLTVAEDKGLLEVLRLPEFTRTLSAQQRQFVDEYVLWTARLTDRQIDWRGQSVDLLPFVRANREQFVIKPANEGRGYGVVIGKYATDDEWQAACEIDANLPCVVQEFAEPARLPVARLNQEAGMQVVDHHLTVGLAMIRGKSQGVLSRISTNPVTNVGREGVVQAVFLTE